MEVKYKMIFEFADTFDSYTAFQYYSMMYTHVKVFRQQIPNVLTQVISKMGENRIWQLTTITKRDTMGFEIKLGNGMNFCNDIFKRSLLSWNIHTPKCIYRISLDLQTWQYLGNVNVCTNKLW